MAARAKRRFGSIRKLPSGRFQVRFLDRTGEERNGPRTFVTRAEADRFLNLTEADLLRGCWTDPRLAKTTFNELAATWESSLNLRTNTLSSYAYVLRRLILPSFGGVAIGEIHTSSVRTWRAWALTEVGHNTVAKAYRLLRQILDVAVEDGLILRNPCNLRGAAVERSPEQRAITLSEVRALADAMDPRYRALVLTTAYGGFRWGELVGLKRKRVNLLHMTIEVAQQVTEPDGRYHEEGKPKTVAGLRTVTMPTPLVTVMEEHLASVDISPEALVFSSPDGTYLRRSNFRRRFWLPACAAAGIADGFTFHHLRHTHASLAAAAGAGTRELMTRMGHASPAAAIRYQHQMPGRDAAIAAVLGDLISAAEMDAEGQNPGPTGTPLARAALTLPSQHGGSTRKAG